MKILICDDNAESVNTVHSLLDKYTDKNNVGFDIKEYFGGDELMNRQAFFDIAFVDIEMPKTNGLTLTKHLKNVNPNIIIFIVTSFNGYLDDAMDLNVFRYLSKPINSERFEKGLDTAIRLYRQNNESLIIETADGCHTVSSQEILYIAIDKRKTKVVTKKCDYISSENLNYWKKATEKLNCFTQPHYSFIVNMKNVTDFTKTEITVSRGKRTETVPISRGHYLDFRRDFFEYMGVTI